MIKFETHNMNSRTNKSTGTLPRGRGRGRGGSVRAPITSQTRPSVTSTRRGSVRPPTPVPDVTRVDTPPLTSGSSTTSDEPPVPPTTLDESTVAPTAHNDGPCYEFTNKTAGTDFMRNDFEVMMLMDSDTFASVTAFVMYSVYKASGGDDHAKHIQQQRSSMYCKLYWKRNPVAPTDKLRSVARSAMYRAVISKFMSMTTC